MTENEIEVWMTELWNVVFRNLGMQAAESCSWYYSNRSIWKYYMDNGISPLEAYFDDEEEFP